MIESPSGVATVSSVVRQHRWGLLGPYSSRCCSRTVAATRLSSGQSCSCLCQRVDRAAAAAALGRGPRAAENGRDRRGLSIGQSVNGLCEQSLTCDLSPTLSGVNQRLCLAQPSAAPKPANLVHRTHSARLCSDRLPAIGEYKHRVCAEVSKVASGPASILDSSANAGTATPSAVHG